MIRECKRATYCKRCFLKKCPFGHDGEPSEDEYPTAKNRCKYYEPKEAFKISELKAYTYDDMIDGKADIDVKYYTKEDADTAIATLQGANDEKAERIVELQKQVDELDGVKKSAEQILQNLLDCGLIKEWYFNGKFNAVLKADDPHLQIAEIKQKLEDAKSTNYAEMVDAGMENYILKRTLWLARAELCRRLDVDRYLRNHRNSWYNENCLTWADACVAMEVKICKAETKCRAKAEEYK